MRLGQPGSAAPRPRLGDTEAPGINTSASPEHPRRGRPGRAGQPGSNLRPPGPTIDFAKLPFSFTMATRSWARGCAALGQAGFKSRGAQVPSSEAARDSTAASTRAPTLRFLKSRPQLGAHTPVPAPRPPPPRPAAPSALARLLGDSALGPHRRAPAAAAQTNAKFLRANLWVLTLRCIPGVQTPPPTQMLGPGPPLVV